MTAVAVRPDVRPDDLAPEGWWALWRALSPRRRLRVDRGRQHVFLSEDLPEIEPEEPYALYLAGWDGRFRLLGLDLDTTKGNVEESCARLRRLFDDAGIEYVVADSGPHGGQHIWSTWPETLDKDTVRRLGAALQVIAPALDTGALTNPAAGCIRPIGAPHRHGGRSQLLAEWTPQRAQLVLRRGNPSDRLESLWAVLPAAIQKSSIAPVLQRGTDADRQDATTPKPQSAAQQPDDEQLVARRARLVATDERGWPHLIGRHQQLDPTARNLLYSELPEDADSSAVLWQILLRLVFARWTYADLQHLLADPSTHGLKHLRSRRGEPGRPRRLRTPAEQRSETARQWRQAVNRAVELYRDNSPTCDPQLQELVALIQHEADHQHPNRWTGQAGPGDRLVLDAICLLVLNHGINPIGASVRMLADMTGLGASTARRVLHRLARPTSSGRGWLTAAEPAEGRLAATWQLTDPATQVSDYCLEEDIPSPNLTDIGGTQGEPAPRGTGALPTPPSTEDFQAQLRARLDHQKADVWTPHGGLGHHTARTHHAVITSGRLTFLDLARLTGYSMRTVRSHLRKLAALRLVEVRGHTVASSNRALSDAAQELGVDGTAAARRLRHSVDRETVAWWTAEMEWRSTKGKQRRRDRHGRRARRGPPQPIAGTAQAVLPITVGPRNTYGHFPVHATGPRSGRADFSAAARMVHAHLTRSVIAAAREPLVLLAANSSGDGPYSSA